MNNILVKPDDDLSGIQGLKRGKWTYAVKGTVAAVPDNLICFHKEVAKMKEGGIHPSQLFRAGDMAQNSTDVYSYCELKVGDRVFFPYLCQNEEPVLIDGVPHLLIKYDQIICREDLYPLNSYLIVRMSELESEYFEYKDVNDYGMAEVVSAGKLLEDRNGDTGDPSIVPGDFVIFEKNTCVRLEADALKTLNEDSQSSFFRVKRQNILMRNGQNRI